MLKFITLSLYFVTLNAYSMINECGEYSFNGIIEKKDSVPYLNINKGTNSQFIIEFDIEDTFRLVPYINKHVQGKLKILNKTGAYSSKDSKIIDIDYRVPNPLKEKDTFLKLLTKENCTI